MAAAVGSQSIYCPLSRHDPLSLTLQPYTPFHTGNLSVPVFPLLLSLNSLLCFLTDVLCSSDWS